MSAPTRLACAGRRERAAAVARVVRARRDRDAAENALCRLREPAAALVLAAHFAGPLPDARALLERRAERQAEAYAEALRGLGLVLSAPLAQPPTNGAAP